jgi:phospholipid/cholesterol/gamma-HCH transport system substrate-binding protein
MRETTTEVLAGVAVVAVAGAFLAYAAQMTGWSQGSTGYALTASFRSAEGVLIGTDVRLAGVKIGTVTGLSLDPVTYRAATVMTIAADVPVPDDSSAIISTEGLLGGSFVEIMPGGSLDALPDGAEIIDTQGAISVVALLMKFVSGDQSGDLAE